MSNAELVQSVVADFERRARDTRRDGADEGRRRAIESVARQGLPSTALEGWRYTSLRALYDAGLRNAKDAVAAPAAWGPPLLEGAVEIRILDGRGVDAPAPAVPGLQVRPLFEAVQSDARARRALNEHLGFEGESFAALNAAFWSGGVYVQVGRGVTLERPVLLRYGARAAAGEMLHPRALVVCEAESGLTLIETYESVGGADGYVDNAVTELVLDAGARLLHVRVQDEGPAAYHFATVQAALDRDASLRSVQLALGGSTSRVANRGHLGGPGASIDLGVLGLGRGAQHLAQHVIQEHAAPHGQSQVFVKNVLDDKASAVFDARLIVRPGAKQSNGSQTNHNLLLSKHATAHTRPQLEIHHDDVKAAHGATVGQLDGDQLFYLRARGIAEAEARRALTRGFASEVLQRAADTLPEALRAALHARVQERL